LQSCIVLAGFIACIATLATNTANAASDVPKSYIPQGLNLASFFGTALNSVPWFGWVLLVVVFLVGAKK
jgi:hypothetical protein